MPRIAYEAYRAVIGKNPDGSPIYQGFMAYDGEDTTEEREAAVVAEAAEILARRATHK